MFTSLSVSAGVQEFWQKVVVFFTVTVKDFFVNLLQNKPVAFYLIIAGAALLLAGIIALIVVGAKKSKAKKAAKKAKKAKLEAQMSVELKDMVNRMQRDFGTKVSAIGNDKKGRIYIDYYTRDDLDRIIEILDILEKNKKR